MTFDDPYDDPAERDTPDCAATAAALYQKWLERDGPKGSVQWYIHRLRHHMYQGSSMTVYKFVQWAVERKLSSNMSRSEFEEWLRMIAATAPQDAIIPASWHIIKSIIKLPKLEDYTSHVCVCHQYRYERIKKEMYEDHRDDRCPRCNELRFMVDAGGRLQPRHWVWYLGLDNAIQQLFNDPDFTSKRGKSRGLGRWTWYGSKYAEEMNDKTNGALFDANNSAYSLFVDGFQPFAGATYTSWVIVLRCEDLDLETRSKRCFHLPIMIIPGPKQPKFSYIYLEMIANDFQRLGPDGPGMEVHPATGWHEGALIRGPKFVHRALFSGDDADSPAMWWTGEFIKGANAYNVCNYCKFNGVSEGTRRVYAGYGSPVLAIKGLGRGSYFQIGIRDDLRLLSHEEQCTRASMVVTDPSLSSELGCKGLCVFVEKLDYIDYNCMFRLPIAHNFLLGLVKNFWRDAFRWMAGGKRKPIDSCVKDIAMSTSDIEKVDSILQQGLLLTSDFNRGFNGLQHLGDWKAEDWWRFTEVYSPFIQKNVIGVGLPPIGQAIWENLRTFIMHHLQPPCEEAYRARERNNAREAILQVARLAEKHYRSFLTHNLHKAACFAHVQEDWCGMLSMFNELWGERALMPLKRLCRNARVEPEKVMANASLARMCLRNLALQFSVRINDEDVMSSDTNESEEETSEGMSDDEDDSLTSTSVDSVIENDGSQMSAESDAPEDLTSLTHDADTGLQGAGREPREWERKIVLIGLKTLADKDELEWNPDLLAEGNPDLSITIFAYAFIHKSETITSEIYKRSISRESCTVKVRNLTDFVVYVRGAVEFTCIKCKYWTFIITALLPHCLICFNFFFSGNIWRQRMDWTHRILRKCGAQRPKSGTGLHSILFTFCGSGHNWCW